MVPTSHTYKPNWFKGVYPEMYESVYYTLTSQANPPGIPNNELVATLPHPMDFGHHGQYEVALTSLRFTLDPPKPKEVAKDVSQNVNQEDPIEQPMETSEKEKEVLFPDYSLPKLQTIKVKKENTQILSFMSSINKALESHGVKLGYMITADPPEVELHVTISHDLTEPHMHLCIPTELANLMGYRRTDFFIGKHLPEELMTDKEFQKIPVGTEYEMHLVTPTYLKNTVSSTCGRFLKWIEFLQSKMEPVDFFSWLSREILKQGYTCNFNVTDPENCVIEVETPEQFADDYIQIPEKIITCLGFSSHVFKNGRHESKVGIDMETFKTIEPLDEFIFTFHVSGPNPKYMLEPASLELDDVIEQINSTIRPAFAHMIKPATFHYYKGSLVLDDIDYKVSVQLPELVNVYFGFDKDQIFTNGTSAAIKEELVKEEDRKHESEDDDDDIIPAPPPDVPARQVVVLSNLCRNQFYAGKPVPLIRELDIPIMHSEEESTVSPVLNHFIYLPMDGNQVQTFRIKLCDEYLRPLKCKEGTITSAQLHIRLSF